VRRGGLPAPRIALSEAGSEATGCGGGLLVVGVRRRARVRPLLPKRHARCGRLSLRGEGEPSGSPRPGPPGVRGPDRPRVPGASQAGGGSRPPGPRRATGSLHLRGEPRPVELDPASFELDERPRRGPPCWSWNAWVEALFPKPPATRASARKPPALSRPRPRTGAHRASAPSPAPKPRRPSWKPRQFRFYPRGAAAWSEGIEERREVARRPLLVLLPCSPSWPSPGLDAGATPGPATGRPCHYRPTRSGGL